MRYTVDTTNKTIEIDFISGKELKKLIEKYPDYAFIGKTQIQTYNPYIVFREYYENPFTITCKDESGKILN